jgi:hypothetical protein
MADLKLELKAYKCIFPDFFIDAYNQYRWEDDKQYEVIFGKNTKGAILERCKNDESYTFWELKKHIRTRRYPKWDLYSQPRSAYLEGLTEKQINHLTHSLGVRIGGTCPDEFYRNYSFYYSKHADCEHLVSLGLMENYERMGSQTYHVTKKGIYAVKTLLLVRKEVSNG